LNLNSIPRIYPIIDTATLARLSYGWMDAAAALLEGGARIVQFRHKDFWNREVFAQVSEIARLCRASGAILIVNDRSDYAALLRTGVHLGQDDLSPGDARRVSGSDAIIGLSTHNLTQLDEARNEPVDYVALGPIFGTASKERPDPQVGVEGLRAMRASANRPLVAIGGINRQNAVSCWNAGADSVAVIGDIFPSPCTHTSLRARMEEWVALGETAPRITT
jgi:thiamine-phosphate pyrophosphorylase